MLELSLFAKITLKPEHFDEALKAIRATVEQTRAEPGCLRFELNVGLDGAPILYLVEHWKDDTALALHYEKSDTKAIFKAYETWQAKPPMIIKMRRDT